VAIYVISNPEQALRATIEATYSGHDVFFAGTEPSATFFEHLDDEDRIIIPEGSSPLLDFLMKDGNGFLSFTGTLFAKMKVVRVVRDGKW
jgi:hypothetical protein